MSMQKTLRALFLTRSLPIYKPPLQRAFTLGEPPFFIAKSKKASEEDITTLTKSIEQVLDGKKWALTSTKAGLERRFKFGDFGGAWNFMTQVARECEKTNHHPEWSNVYNQVNVTWTTHRPRGISMKDVRMVGFCDRVAGDVGEVE